jgi:hypothetical protein
MLLLEGYISYFTCARYYFLYEEFSGFYVNQSVAGQTLVILLTVCFLGACIILGSENRHYTFTDFLRLCFKTMSRCFCLIF